MAAGGGKSTGNQKHKERGSVSSLLVSPSQTEEGKVASFKAFGLPANKHG